MFSQKFYRVRFFSLLVFLFMAFMVPVQADNEQPQGPPPPPPNPPHPNPCGSSCCTPVCSDAALQDGNLTLDYRLPFYRSLGISRSLRFVYNSTTADVRPIMAQDLFVPSPFGAPATVSARLMINGQSISFPQGSEIFYDGGLRSRDSVRMALPFDANDLPTGLHSYTLTLSQNFANRSISVADIGQVIVNNQRNSPFGAGWGLDGLQKLQLDPRSDQAVVAEGDGAANVFSLKNPTDLFTVRREFTAARSPAIFAAIAEDFNGDEILDLAVVGGLSGSVLLGDGQGHFSNPRFFDLVGPTSIPSVAVGDFNGDGHPDLAVAIDGGRISILLGNGDGNFCRPPLSCPAPIESGTLTVTIAVGDFDGDGKLDLVAAGPGDFSGGSVSILLGNGDGTFRRRPAINFPTRPNSVMVADFNGDGSDDLVVVTDVGISILINRADGMGDFQPRRDFDLNRRVTSMAIGDFNNDGYPDLAMSLADINTYVLIALGDGIGGISQRREFDLGLVNFPRSIVVGDFNQDGQQDVAVADMVTHTLSILLGDGQGNLTGAKSYRTAVNPTSIVAGDFNSDDRLDLVATSTSGVVSLLLGEGTGNFLAAPYFSSGWSDPGAIAVGDFNGDGSPDLVVGAEAFGVVIVLLGDGQGRLSFPQRIDLPPLQDVRSIGVGDFNGDGHQDIAVAGRPSGVGGGGRTVAILLGNGDGTFRPAMISRAGGMGAPPCDHCMALGDFNRDNHLDIAIALDRGIAILLGNGDGTFQPPRLISPGEVVTSIATGDFNRDTNPDLAVTVGTDVLILRGNGAGDFQPAGRLPVGGVARSIAIGDFNRDGHPDLAITTPNHTAILIGNGDGTFRLPARIFPLVQDLGLDRRPIVVGDFNGDDKPDLAVRNLRGVSVLLGDGQGNFPTRLDFPEYATSDLTASDFNSDGKPDLAISNGISSDTVSLLLSFPSSPAGDYSQLARDTGSVCGANVAFTRTMKDGRKIHFNAGGQHLATVDRNNNTTCYRYNADGTLASITDPVGLVATFTYTAGHLTSVRDPAGRITMFTMDEAGNLTSITDPTQAVAQYAYDDDHHLTSRTDPRGFTFSYQYNFAGRFESSTLPDGSTRRVSAAQMAGLVNPASGRGTRENPAPVVRTDQVNSSYTDGRGNRITYTTDNLGGAASSVDAENRRTEVLRDGNGNPTKITEANGVVTVKTYDVRGNLLSTTNRAINATTTFTYEPRFNQVTSIRDPRGNIERFEYDARGNLITQIDALNNRTTMTYDARGLLVSMGRDGITRPMTFTYDDKGNLLTSTDPLGNVTTFEYDAAGNLRRAIDAEGRARAYTYDGMNRLTSVTDASGGVTNYIYEPGCCGGSTGLLSSITDAEGRTTTFEYDSMGRLASITNPLKQTKTFRYDGNGNLISTTDARGRTITFEYDRVNQLRFKRRPLPDSTIEYRYDQVGNLVEVRESNNASVVTRLYDRANRLTNESMAGTILPPRTITYDYDLAGNRTRMVDPQGATLYMYDELNRLRRLTNPGNQVTTFDYDRLSRRSVLTLANGTSTTYTYDDDSRLTSLVARRGETTISSFQYTYDRVGNRRTMTEMAGQNSYTYDETYRLTNATHPQDVNPEELFTFDGVGNRLTSHLSETYVYDDANRLLQDDKFKYTYDANGNLTSKEGTGSLTTYTYNSENQLTRVNFPDGTSAAYDYDGLGRRIRKNVNGITTKYIYDNEGILYELDGSNNVVARYTRGKGIDEVLSMDRIGQSFFYHVDALGSVVKLTNVGGDVIKSYTYDVFGRIVEQAEGVDQPFTYTGREYDRETGLYYYRARYYDPSLGRFLSEDPGFNPGLKFAAIPSIPYLLPDSLIFPEEVHSYTYVLNNPVNLTDPTGLSCKTDCADKKLGCTRLCNKITYYCATVGAFICISQGKIPSVIAGCSAFVAAFCVLFRSECRDNCDNDAKHCEDDCSKENCKSVPGTG